MESKSERLLITLALGLGGRHPMNRWFRLSSAVLLILIRSLSMSRDVMRIRHRPGSTLGGTSASFIGTSSQMSPVMSNGPRPKFGQRTGRRECVGAREAQVTKSLLSSPVSTSESR